jgi:hypothetical protein
MVEEWGIGQDELRQGGAGGGGVWRTLAWPVRKMMNRERRGNLKRDLSKERASAK